MKAFQVIMEDRAYFTSDGKLGKTETCGIYFNKEDAERVADNLRFENNLKGAWEQQIKIKSIKINGKPKTKLSDYAILRRANKIANVYKGTNVFPDISDICKMQRLRCVMRHSIPHMINWKNSIVGDMINGYTMYGDIWYKWHNKEEE